MGSKSNRKNGPTKTPDALKALMVSVPDVWIPTPYPQKLIKRFPRYKYVYVGNWVHNLDDSVTVISTPVKTWFLRVQWANGTLEIVSVTRCHVM